MDTTHAGRLRVCAGAHRQVAHLARLVDDLLDVTRVARGKIELRRADLDLAALARRTAEDLRPVMQDRRLGLEVRVPEVPVVVNRDETRLAQVLGNLLHNAIKFTPAGGRVTVALRVDDSRATVRVVDTGVGIEPDVIATIFEPYTQGRQTLARGEAGLGLGLALVRGLVALHGGDAAAHSKGQGAGTEVIVRLPLATVHDTDERRRTVRTLGNGRSHRVLVIDDNRDAAESLAQLVSIIGHDVVVAYNAFDGLAMAADHVPDVVLCDIGLPGIDGYEFARRFRASSSSNVRLVAVTGYAQPEDVARAVDAGFDAHVPKPPDPDRIASLLA